MTLFLNEKEIYENSYYTNWNYLQDMSELQMELLQGMEWDEDYEHILTGLSDLPWAFSYKKDAEYSIKEFIDDLNKELRGL